MQSPTEKPDKIAIFCTEKSSGGITQFSMTLAATIRRQGLRVCLFTPKTNGIPSDTESLKFSVKLPLRVTKKEISRIVSLIGDLGIRTAIFANFGYCAAQISLALSKKSVRCFQCIHDVVPHQSRKSIKSTIIGSITQAKQSRVIKKAAGIILMSPLSLRDYELANPRCDRSKLVLLTLGAHVPNDSPQSLAELSSCRDYLLCFGRMEPYKDLETLVAAFRASRSPYPLVIAGAGLVPPKTLDIVNKTSNITLINRFITNGEMITLFKDCKAVILPYISATQSGVLPLAYFFGKPVISTRIEHLLYFIKEGETGLTYSSENELIGLLSSLTDEQVNRMSKHCLEYCEDSLNWDRNILPLMSAILS